VLPRAVAETTLCDTCDNPVAGHQGPVVMPGGLYQVREVAEALDLLAQGRSYTDTARVVRARYWTDHPKTQRTPGGVEGGQTVADWLDQFGRVVAAAHAETAWPQTLVVDGTTFKYTNPRTGGEKELFCVFAAYGYEPSGARRLWRLAASPARATCDWEAFLRQLPGTPAHVVSDSEPALVNAIDNLWPGAGYRCEHHLYNNVHKALLADGVRWNDGSALGPLVADAFHSPAGWSAFTAEALTGAWRATAKWVGDNDVMVSAQVARRATVPGVYSNGAVELQVAAVREVLSSRSWTFRNLYRMNLLLELVRQRLNRHNGDLTVHHYSLLGG
jgi:hypothetical protein